MITGVGRFEPGNPVTLTKHTIKEDFSTLNKEKWDVELETYAALSAQDLHSGYLNRLYTSFIVATGIQTVLEARVNILNIEVGEA